MKNEESYPSDLLKDYKILLEYFPSHKEIRPFIIDVIRDWAKNNKKEDELKIIEVGSGFGESTELIFENINCNMVLVEKDIQASNFLKDSLSKFSKSIEIVNDDIFNLIKDIKDDSYDVFTASWTIHNFTEEERSNLLPEIFRILKPNGLFVVFDKVISSKKDEEEFWKIHKKRLSELDKRGLSNLKEDMISHEERDRRKPYVWYENNLIQDLDDSGFRKIKIHKRFERDIVFSAIK